MESLYIYAVLAIVIWIVAHYLYKIRSAKFIQSFIDSQNSITILSTVNKVKNINEIGLKTFGFSSLKSFLTETNTLLNFFLVEEGCLDKYTYGKNWIEKVEQTKNQGVKVKVRSKEDGLLRYFQIKVSQLQGTKEYILIFTDISEIERSKNELQKTSEIDPLTKIYNRVKVNEFFDNLFVNVGESNQTFSVILFDIDHFKMINDTYGHNIGDKVLFELARLTQSLFRSTDTLARWGGEEFIIILKNTTAEQASMLANRVRVAIDQYPFEGVGHLSCSFGVTQYILGDTKANFLERVDKALYEAKENGRDQVVRK